MNRKFNLHINDNRQKEWFLEKQKLELTKIRNNSEANILDFIQLYCNFDLDHSIDSTLFIKMYNKICADSLTQITIDFILLRTKKITIENNQYIGIAFKNNVRLEFFLQ